jgi:3'-phosphoadenosine 5'-phosphosulfate sulfotransferase (PAPS reductase)/FAD synthetase
MGMTPLKIAAFRAHATQTQYQRRLAALQAMTASLDPDRTYVSFSAGKDSAVIAHACHAAHPGIAILMIDPGCPTHWTEAERTAWLDYAAAQGWNLILFPWDKWGIDLQTESVTDYQARIHEAMFEPIQRHAQGAGLTCKVMGLRAAESRNRRMSIGVRGDHYEYKDGTCAVLPISSWLTADVWAYIVTNGLPWLSIYDYLGPEARNGLVGRSGEKFGRLEYLKQHYPDVWRWATAAGVLA